MHRSVLTFLTCLVILVATGFAGSRLARWTSRQIQSLELNHDAAVERERSERMHQQEVDRVRAKELQEQDAAEQRRQWLQAIGGEVAAIVKDPELDIRGMLEALLKHEVPPQSQISVRVERFTEYIVSADVPQRPSHREMAEWTRQLLEHGGRYIHSLQWIHSGEILAELDHPRISGVSDWKSLSEEEIVTLLSAASTNPLSISKAPLLKRRKETLIADDDDTIGNENTDEYSRIVRAEKRFSDRTTELGRSVIQLLQGLQDQLHPQQLGLSEEPAAIELRFTQWAEYLEKIYVFLVRPTAEYERILTAEKVDPVYVRASSRGLMDRYRAAPEAERMLQLLREQIKAMRSWVLFMAQNRASWSVIPERDQLSFVDESIRARYVKDSESLVLQLKALREATQLWVDKAWQKDKPQAP